MRRVTREEILDFVTYGEQRDEIRTRAVAEKELRRVVVADVLTFLFENPDTVRYQILEMVRIERMIKEADIVHEIETYNEILGRDGALGCTLLIGVDDPAARDEKLRAWRDLCPHLFAETEDGERVPPTWDDRQVGEDRLSAVQFLQFPVGGRVPVALGCDHPDLTGRTELPEATRAALRADLADG